MNEQKKQIIVLAVFGAILIGVIVFQVVRMRTPPAVPETPAAESPAPRAPAADTPPDSRAGAQRPSDGEEDYRPMDPDALDQLISRIQRVSFRYPESPGRDPMAPLVRDEMMRPGGPGTDRTAAALPVISPTNKVVSGIIGNENARYAIVDDQPVYPGYVYPDGVQVERIEADKVIFRYEDKLIPVPLKE